MAGNPRDDFESLARRYWAAWGDALRSAVPAAGAVPGMGGPQHVPPLGAGAWQDAIDWWSRMAHGGRAEANDTLAHFNRQARDWYARMQEVAARFAGQESTAVDVARAWKEALGASGENPFPEMLRTLRGHGLQGLEQWVQDASPWLDAMRDEGLSWLRLPAFGAGREHQERMQALAVHLAEYRQASDAYAALMLKAQQEAFNLFEAGLVEHEGPGRRIESGRALFDLWIDAAEEAYAAVALSPEFREVYGRLVNAQMRVRGGVQRMVEDACAQLGMPTRSELDGAHRKIAQLEREMRRMRDAASRGREPTGAAGQEHGADGGGDGGEGAGVLAWRVRADPPAKKAAAPGKATKKAVKKAASKKAASKKAAKKAAKKATAAKAAGTAETSVGRRKR
jgi:class III poly(R)-hydroxyalkanoic acid synthase PhaE subunit